MQTDINIRREDKDEITVVHVGGYLDAHTASKFESQIQEVADEGRYKLVLNFKDLDYISSAGLGAIMGHVEDMRTNDGDIKLAELNDSIFRVFDLVGFPSLYDIVKSQDEALSLFGSDK